MLFICFVGNDVTGSRLFYGNRTDLFFFTKGLKSRDGSAGQEMLSGCVEDIGLLMEPPFDRPYKFSMIFDRDEQIKFVHVINTIKLNAMVA